MYLSKYCVVLMISLFVLLFTGCKKWDDHNALQNPQVGQTLTDAIKATSNLSRFYELLKQTGYDTVLMNSKTFTVWAPDNTALANLDASVLNDAAKLKKFIANHISNQSYLTTNTPTPLRVKMLSGKNNTFYNKAIGSAVIITADQYTGNGILHVINQQLAVLPNIWEYVTTVESADLQKAAVMALNNEIFDSTTAIQIGVDPNTGAPIYQPGSGMILSNRYNTRVYDTRAEDSLYTYFILTDNAFSTQKTRLLPYFATGTADSTDELASYHLIKDLLIRGAYNRDQLPDTLVSKFGVKVPVDKNAIVNSYEVSNGIVYVINKMDFKMEDKFPPFVIQGENPRGFSADRRANTFYRIRTNPNNGAIFNDILVQGHRTALFNVYYNVANVYSVKYKMYWVAVNDFMTTTHQQRLVMDTITNTTFSYVTVPVANYDEVYLGDYNVAKYTSLVKMYLMATNTSGSTSDPLNPLTLDYIKMVPVYY